VQNLESKKLQANGLHIVDADYGKKVARSSA
jgi:hypothetical protein